MSGLVKIQLVDAEGDRVAEADGLNLPAIVARSYNNQSGYAAKYIKGDGTLDTPAGGGGGGSNGLIRQAVVDLSSAQILALHDTPVEIIAAPGAGKFIVLISTSYQYVANTTGYVIDNTHNIGLYFNSDRTGGSVIDDLAPAAGNLFSGTDSGILFGTSASGEARSAVNTPLVYTTSDVNPTTGDGTLRISVTYTIMDIA